MVADRNKTESQNPKQKHNQKHKTQNRITKFKTETQNSKQNHKTQNRNTKLKTDSQTFTHRITLFQNSIQWDVRNA